jgi:N-acetylneuraminic acid mutarotase
LQIPASFSFTGPFQLNISIVNQTPVTLGEFFVNGLNITGFDPSSCVAGDNIKIFGENFSGILSGNQVSINGQSCVVLAASSTQLNIKVAKSVGPGSYPIVLTAGGMTTYSANLITIKPNWVNITIPASGPDVRSASVAFTIGGVAYVGTGIEGLHSNKVYNDFWKYDPATNTWTQLPDFPGGARFSAMAIVLNGKGYVGMGRNLVDEEPLNDLWEYDPASNQWTKKASLPSHGRFAPAAFAIDNKGYVGIGINNSKGIYLKDFWQYDPVTNTWSARQTFSGFGRGGSFVSFVLGGSGYYGFGTSSEVGDAHIGDLWQYDPVANKWTRKKDFVSGATGATAFLINNVAYVAGGSTPQGPGGCWEYVVADDSWIERKASPISFFYGVGFSINNRGYVFGAMSGAAFVPDLIEFNPIP